MKVYAISGLGADKRVFDYLNLNAELISLDWITPKPNEKMEEYSLRLAQSINQKEDYSIIGVSFGGLIATEISKKLHPKFTILISSAETRYELRKIYRSFGKTRITNLISTRLFNLNISIASFLFGTKNKKLLRSILNDTDPYFTKWAINQLLTWKNTTRINCLKISGTNDKLIRPSYGNKTKLIKGGEHFMIVDRAEEISAIINQQLSK